MARRIRLPQRVASQWYVYWFQNFPGRGNQIPHGANWMTNWWAFVADWDAAINREPVSKY